ncbi:MAG TPA: 5'-methylthioadenosine phosphorylase, partial [Candidatus Dormibacteraeota bacterium]|nr:5'-methylthioadenosine phosphorylase [Candidatus Dormibacteraeota bacterium]
TDWDAGLEGEPGVVPVTQEEVFRVFRQSTDAIRDAITRLVGLVPSGRSCGCGAAPQPIGH